MNVTPLIAYQSACVIDVVCVDCNYEFQEMIPVTMLEHPENLRCRGCGKRGHLAQNYANK
jgi:hypothetical protein